MDNPGSIADGSTADAELITLTADITSAYVSNNAVQSAEISKIIETIHASLRSLGGPKSEPAPEKPVPHINIKKTVTPDFLISLEDGKHYKSLKRHLSGRGLTPSGYREKWGLPHDYPMVASAYAAKRSELAKSIGLGRKKAEENPAAEIAAAPAKRGRPRKVEA